MSGMVNDLVNRAAALYPARDAIVYEGRRISYAELVDKSTEVARKLVSLGVKPLDRVALVSENSPEFLIACLAVWRAGGILALVFPSFGPVELEYSIRNSIPKIILVEDDSRAGVVEALDKIGQTVDLLSIGDGSLLDDVAPAKVELPVVEPDNAAIICYTSGTSGRPKPVSHSHAGIACGLLMYHKAWQVTKEDIFICALPLSWTAGLYVLSLTALCAGAAVVLMRRFKPSLLLALMEEEQVSYFYGVTTMYVKLVNELKQCNTMPKLKLRCCFSGGEPRNEAAFSDWKRFTGSEVFDCWAANESWPLATYDLSVDKKPRPGSAGRLLDGAQLRLLNTQGNEVFPGEVGEVESRAPVMMLEYWNEPELTREAFTEDGWYKMRDFARIDDEGYVYVTGRASDMIIRGGVNISPIEIESVLAWHESVLEVAVVGVRDETYGQVICAAVLARPDKTFDADALIALCKKNLAHFKIPSLIVEVDTMPHNASGKVLRREVKLLIEKTCRAGKPGLS